MGCERLAIAADYVIREKVEPPFGDECRVELANRAGSRVARIGKTRLVSLFTLGIDLLKNFAWQISFAAHFDCLSEFGRRSL